MPEPRTVTVYIDYKSPYAYLAKDPAYELARDFPVRLDWMPYRLDIPRFLGSARLDESGRVVEEHRNAHQWRRVKYSYMDCRRQARKAGLVIRGTQKIWDSSLALIGMLYAKRQGEAVLRRYHDITFERFWKRELDIEDPAVVTAVLAEAGADTSALPPISRATAAPSSNGFAATPKSRASSACRALSLTANCSGVASTSPISAAGSPPRLSQRPPRCLSRSARCIRYLSARSPASIAAAR